VIIDGSAIKGYTHNQKYLNNSITWSKKIKNKVPSIWRKRYSMEIWRHTKMFATKQMSPNIKCFLFIGVSPLISLLGHSKMCQICTNPVHNKPAHVPSQVVLYYLIPCTPAFQIFSLSSPLPTQLKQLVINLGKTKKRLK